MRVLIRSAGTPLGLLTGLVLVIVACSGTASAPPATNSRAAVPPASVAASSTPAAATSPSARPSATPLPEGTFKVTARHFKFQPVSLTVTAGKPFTIVFKNFDDPGILHDVDIRKKDGKTVVVDQEATSGGLSSDYVYPKLEPGEYMFVCSFHVDLMTGTLTVT